MILNDHSRDGAVFLQFHLGGDRNFHYLLGGGRTREAVAVDPGFAPEEFLKIARERELEIRHILITHGHSDHTGGAAELARLTGAGILAGSPAAAPGAVELNDDQILHLGGLVVRAMATPGHAPDHFCFLCDDRLITGDLLFCGKIGGTGPHFPGSSAEEEFDSLQRVMRLPAETLVFPGHDYFGGEGSMPHSTIGFEREHNPFLACRGLAAFCHLKDHWARYKQEHGIR